MLNLTAHRLRYRIGVCLTAFVAVAGVVTACTDKSSGAGETFTITAPTGYLPSANWNPFATANTVNQAVGPLAFAPLAFGVPTAANNGNTFSPQLAKSWSYEDNYTKFVVHLRPNLKWSDGTALTSKDVVVSWKLYAMIGQWTGLQISKVTAVDTNTIEFDRTLNKGQPAYSVGFENTLLNFVIVPAASYGKYVPPDATFDTLVAKLWNAQTAAAPDSADYKKYSAELTKLSKSLLGYSPGNGGLVTAGPYKVRNFTPSAVVLEKNKYNWAASNIHIDKVTVLNNTSTTAVNNAVVTGQVDAIGNQPSAPLYRSITSRNKDMHFVKPSYYLTNNGILFNMHVYPYNILQVRQAFMYILDRKSALGASNPVAGTTTDVPAGIPRSVFSYYLTPDEIKSLNPYDHDTDKATQLLKSAGFTKRGSTWYTPKGSEFTATVYSASTLSSWELLATNVASQLSSFGISAKTQLVPVNTYSTQQLAGRFGLFAGYVGGNAFPPYSSFSYILQTLGGWTFTPQGDQVQNKQQPGYAIPESSSVPGVGTVNPAEVAYQMSVTPDKTKLQQLAYKAVKWMNYNAEPGVLLYQTQSYFYSTKRFTDWPTDDEETMDLIGRGSANYFLTAAVEKGFLKAK